MKTKRKGTRQEHRTMALLEAAGYRCIRSGGSLGEWDVVGIGPQGTVLVQVKSRDWPGTLEMGALQDSCAYPHVTRLVHRWRDRQRTPDVREL
jgi:Holliday junction resolvase-like predicted endonuclease